ncbi:aspartate--tRNA ligase [Candidatus Saccharibacteria bacterium]|nr:aspartate--tRNA ligase [Candidatus Saccharibacteria bacterium]
MNRTLATEAVEKIGEQAIVAGWVHSRRDHGGLLFIDLRDHTGLIQLVINPETSDAFTVAQELRDEYVIRATGTIRERLPELKNDKIPTGGVELAAAELSILNRSETLPIQPFAEAQANEDLRLKYRYLDLRRPKAQENLKKRAAYYKFMRDYMESHDFTEVTTPILANSSPEGARDFLVPSRVHQGKFYALPQAPQQFKQLLMVGGVPRYYQIATCFRDEDPRADRLYGDFYQLDLEMAFVEDGDEVRRTMEPLITSLVTEFAGKTLVFGDEVPRISYVDAIERYGSDKPDLRFGMELVELSDIVRESDFGVFKKAIASGGAVKAICVENGATLSRSQIDGFTEIAKQEGAGGLAYIVYEQGVAKSPIAKFMTHDELTAIRERTGAKDGDAVFFGADTRAVVNAVLGRLRNEFATHFGLKDLNQVALAWIVDFPFYEFDAKTNKMDFGHNPFSMPKGGLKSLEETENKLDIVADQYDMVMNGYEICSGGVRNHNPDVLYKVFGLLDFSPQYVEQKFGAMLNAFKFGAPPHAGCAFGIDRIFMVLTGEDNIREVIAFPKNGSGVDVMMSSPSSVDANQRKELGL